MSGPDGEVWSSSTEINGVHWHHILAADLRSPYTLAASDLGYPVEPVSHMVLENTDLGSMTVLPWQPTEGLKLPACGKLDFKLLHAAPLLEDAWYLLGEAEKIIPISRSRIQQLHVSQDLVEVQVSGTKNEVVSFWFGRKGQTETWKTDCTVSSIGMVTISAAWQSSFKAPKFSCSVDSANRNSVPPPTEFPFLFDVGGINASTLSPNVPRVRFNEVFECPHPCGSVPLFNSSGDAVNGGIPQLANFTEHMMVLKNTFDMNVPITESRFVDLDYESWNPVWSRNSPDGPYCKASRALVRAQHPSWTPDQIESEAKKQWEAAAKDFLIKTIAFVKTIRPQIRVGMYNFPSRFYYNGYNTNHSAILKAENDNLFPLWCSMDALFPTVYQFYNSCNSTNPQVKANNQVSWLRCFRSNALAGIRIFQHSRSSSHRKRGA